MQITFNMRICVNNANYKLNHGNRLATNAEQKDELVNDQAMKWRRLKLHVKIKVCL